MINWIEKKEIKKLRGEKKEFLQWEYEKDRLRAYIMFDTVYLPGGYTLMCSLLNIDKKELHGTNIEKIKKSAENILRQEALKLLNSLSDFI